MQRNHLKNSYLEGCFQKSIFVGHLYDNYVQQNPLGLYWRTKTWDWEDGSRINSDP